MAFAPPGRLPENAKAQLRAAIESTGMVGKPSSLRSTPVESGFERGEERRCGRGMAHYGEAQEVGWYGGTFRS